MTLAIWRRVRVFGAEHVAHIASHDSVPPHPSILPLYNILYSSSLDSPPHPKLSTLP